MREHVTRGEALQEAIIIASIPLTDLAVHLHVIYTVTLCHLMLLLVLS